MSDGSNANMISRAFNVSFSEAYKIVQEGGVRKSKLMTVVNRKRLEEEDAAAVESEFIPFPAVPTVPRKMKAPEYDAQVRRLYSTFRMDQVYVEDNGKRVLAVNPLMYLTYPVDKVAVAICRDILGSASASVALKTARNVLMTSGNEKALLSRLIKVGTTNPPSSPGQWDPQVVVTHTLLREDEKHFTSLTETEYKPNWRSSAGMPYMRPKPNGGYYIAQKGEVIDDLMGGVVDLFELFKKGMGAVKSFIQANPHEYLVLLKNKTELVDLDKFLSKCRPYYVVPAKFQIIYSMFWEVVLGNVVSFNEDRESAFMPGFSWTGGGAEYIVECARSLERGAFRVFIYADDVHLLVKLADGSVYIYCPDVSGLDGSFRYSDVDPCTRITLALIPFAPPVWRTVGALAIHHAVSTPVLFDHSLVYRVQSMFKSGFPGTTFIDYLKVANAMFSLLYRKDGTPAKFSTLDGLVAFTARCMTVFREHGMTLHADTQSIYPFIDKDGLFVAEMHPEVKVLGQQLVTRQFGGTLVYLPASDKGKLFASFVRPASLAKESEISKLRRILARCMGLTVSGGYMYEDFYSCARYYYEKTREIVKARLFPFDQSSFDDVEISNGYDFPEVAKLFLEDEEDEKTGAKYVVLKPFPPAYLFVSLYTGITPLSSDIIVTPMAGKFQLPGAPASTETSHLSAEGGEEEIQEPPDDKPLTRRVVKVESGHPARLPYDPKTIGSLKAEPPVAPDKTFKPIRPTKGNVVKENLGSPAARAALQQKASNQIERTKSKGTRVGKGGKLQQALAQVQDHDVLGSEVSSDALDDLKDDEIEQDDFGENLEEAYGGNDFQY